MSVLCHYQLLFSLTLNILYCNTLSFIVSPFHSVATPPLFPDSRDPKPVGMSIKISFALLTCRVIYSIQSTYLMFHPLL